MVHGRTEQLLIIEMDHRPLMIPVANAHTLTHAHDVRCRIAINR